MKKLVLAVVALMVWAGAMAQLPRAEYPRPQMERAEWVNLNGEWTYTLDLVKTGWERNLMQSKGFDDKIIVPFAPESKLSGVEHKEFIPCIWYQRDITIPAAWSGKDVVLNFGAVYYESEIYVDGQFVDRHFGGSDSFSVDITKFVEPGKTHSLVVSASSDLRSGRQSAGKQSLYTKEEEKMINETRNILGDDSIRITATTVRVPVFNGHSESINLEFDKQFDLSELRSVLENAPGIVVQDDTANNVYPMAIYAEGHDETFVGRIRRDESVESGVNLWVVADNIRKGAAANAVQIAKKYIEQNEE